MYFLCLSVAWKLAAIVCRKECVVCKKDRNIICCSLWVVLKGKHACECLSNVECDVAACTVARRGSPVWEK
jgi:hypothetical protein